eukprot:1235511-Rhodomonas_salina.1
MAVEEDMLVGDIKKEVAKKLAEHRCSSRPSPPSDSSSSLPARPPSDSTSVVSASLSTPHATLNAVVLRPQDCERGDGGRAAPAAARDSLRRRERAAQGARRRPPSRWARRPDDERLLQEAQ